MVHGRPLTQAGRVQGSNDGARIHGDRTLGDRAVTQLICDVVVIPTEGTLGQVQTGGEGV